jgi:OPA family glycerol-3-phosphate transporter-like MFS transporter
MAATAAKVTGPAIEHSRAFRIRRFLNWFPLGLVYALLYMGRYNITVAKSSLSTELNLMTNEDFGVISGVGSLVYALAFWLNGPLVDRIGGRKGILISAVGALSANVAMGAYLHHVLTAGLGPAAPLRLVFSVLYAVNMYFQSYGAVSIVKINAHWFHVTERGGFSGIFGSMISSGLFLAYTVNGWFLALGEVLFPGRPSQWIVFFAPAALLGLFVVIEGFLLRDRPGLAGFTDFDTGDASSGEDDNPTPTREIFRRLFTNPVLLTVAGIEFCTGVLRRGVMDWFPIYAKEVWALDRKHPLVNGEWKNLWLIAAMFGVAAVSGFFASRTEGKRRAYYVIAATLAALSPFVQAGWGGLLMIAGIIGSNVAGWVSDLFFQSRRGPAVAGLYLVMAVCAAGMIFTLAEPTNRVSWADEKSGLKEGDEVRALAGKQVTGWADVRAAALCVKPICVDSGWDAKACKCTASLPVEPAAAGAPSAGIPASIVRDGQPQDITLPDPAAKQKAGDQRGIKARPVLPQSPYALGAFLFLISLAVIGAHGLLSGTVTMDFGGRKGAATAVGMIDGAVYLGTSVQAVALGFLTTKSWAYWPPFLLPFAAIGFALSIRIRNARPKSSKSAAV